MAYNTDIETGAVKDGTLYWTTKDVIPCGTCSTGTITTSYEKLVEAFGKPVYVGTHGEKVNIEWDIEFGVADFENPDETVIATVYNWKDYDGGAEAMSNDSYEWHIGGHGYEAVECVRKALGLDTEEKPVPSIHIEGYGCLSPKNIKSNIKRYLSRLSDINIALDSTGFEDEFENINNLAYLLKAHTEALNAYEKFGRGIENIDAFDFKNPFEGKHPFDYTSEDHEKWAKIKAEIGDE
jgi:hypothetical protein